LTPDIHHQELKCQKQHVALPLLAQRPILPLSLETCPLPRRIPLRIQHPNVLTEKTSPALNSASAPVANKDSTKKPSTKKTSQKAATQSTDKTTASYLDIKLDGEDDNSIPIYDTCSTVRQKINALLGKDNHKPENAMPGEFDKQGNPKPYTKASFCRAIDSRPDMLARFLKAKLMMGGAESSVYPKAYAFFEKKRIFEGKKKTPGRLKVEAE
jgi:hypothetical protein